MDGEGRGLRGRKGREGDIWDGVGCGVKRVTKKGRRWLEDILTTLVPHSWKVFALFVLHAFCGLSLFAFLPYLLLTGRTTRCCGFVVVSLYLFYFIFIITSLIWHVWEMREPSF